MDNYTKMKLSDELDENGFDNCDIELEEYMNSQGSQAEAFKRKYKEYYTDIKLTIKEDW